MGFHVLGDGTSNGETLAPFSFGPPAVSPVDLALPMALSAGTRLGPDEILSALGGPAAARATLNKRGRGLAEAKMTRCR